MLTSVCMTPLVSLAQTDYQVSTEVQKKKVLLEEFTGIHCGWCPEGHKISQRMLKGMAGQAYAINIHAGSYSEPNGGEPDYRTPEGDSLSVLLNSAEAGYPCGTINREAYDGHTLYSRSLWIPLAQYYNEQDAPVNLYVKSVYDGETGQLTVHVEGYYTAQPSAGTHTLNVCWTQSDILGPQNGGGVGDAYSHQHMLRDYVTPLWGDTLLAAQGQYFVRDYVYTLPQAVGPAAVKPEDISVIAFVTTDKVGIENVEGGKPLYTHYNETPCGELKGPDMPIGTRYGYNYFDLYLKNKSSQRLTSATFDVTVDGITEEQTVSCDIDQFSTGAVRIPATLRYAAKGKTKYSVVLTGLNGTEVTRDTLSGGFQKPAYTNTTVRFQITTDTQASQNQFLLKDADGNVVKEFGPYADGKVETYTETATLEEGKTYCMEITDSWGDGMLSGGKGALVVRSGNNRLIDQFYTITGYGVRSFFTVDTAAGIQNLPSHTEAAADTECYTIDGRPATQAPRGLYLVKQGDKTMKIINHKKQ